MTVKFFVDMWNGLGYAVRCRTVCGELCWTFTGAQYSFFIPAKSILHVVEALKR